MAKRQKRPTRPAALPPIPSHTPEGIRAQAIRETIAALLEVKNGVTIQTEEATRIAAALSVPALFVEQVTHRDYAGDVTHDGSLEEFIAWRHQLAGKAVA